MIWLVVRLLGRGTETRSPRGAGCHRFNPQLEVLDGRTLPSTGLGGVAMDGMSRGVLLQASPDTPPGLVVEYGNLTDGQTLDQGDANEPGNELQKKKKPRPGGSGEEIPQMNGVNMSDVPLFTRGSRDEIPMN